MGGGPLRMLPRPAGLCPSHPTVGQLAERSGGVEKSDAPKVFADQRPSVGLGTSLRIGISAGKISSGEWARDS